MCVERWVGDYVDVWREGRKVETVHFSSYLFLHTHRTHHTTLHTTTHHTHKHTLCSPPLSIPFLPSYFRLPPSPFILLPSQKVFNKDALEDHSHREARGGDVQP